MKKATMTVLVLAIFVNIYGQNRAVIVKDTAKYMGRNFIVGDTITLGYGSKSNKDFAFIFNPYPTTSNFSKSLAIIENVFLAAKNGAGFIIKGKVYLQAKLPGKQSLLFGTLPFFIDLEGAIDNKELL